MLNRSDILNLVRESGPLRLGPVELRVGGGTGTRPTGPADDDFISTTSLWVARGEQEYEFVADVVSEIVARGTPKELGDVARRLKQVARRARQKVEAVSRSVGPLQWSRVPLVIAPYLSEERLEDLMAEGVSGLDLCGNGVLMAEGLFVFKSGQKNRYPQSVRLRNIYRGKSSLVPRALLLQRGFSAVKDLVSFINDRDADISFSLVSKALKQLAEDVFIARDDRAIRCLQPDAILDALRRAYQPPRISDRWLGRCDAPSLDDLARAIQKQAQDTSCRFVITGAMAASAYSGVAFEPMVSIFTDGSIPPLLESLSWDLEEDRRFANLELLRTTSDWVYFDCRTPVPLDLCIESLVQTYLRLANGEARERKAAAQIIEELEHRWAQWGMK